MEKERNVLPLVHTNKRNPNPAFAFSNSFAYYIPRFSFSKKRDQKKMIGPFFQKLI
jgi:hypothetical protein